MMSLRRVSISLTIRCLPSGWLSLLLGQEIPQNYRGEPLAPIAHSVADAADRPHVARRAGIITELPAQVPDVDVDQMLVANPGLVPHGVDELSAGEDHRGST